MGWGGTLWGDGLWAADSYPTSSGSSGGRFDLDADLALSGGSSSAGVCLLDLDGLLKGGSTSGGTVDYELIAALVQYANYVLSLDTKRTYKFDSYSFDGMGRFNNKLIAAIGNKIYDLESAATQDGSTNIDAYFEIETDFGVPNKCGIKGIMIDDDNMTITITDAAGNVLAQDITAGQMRSLPRNLVSKSFTVRIANKNGASVTFRRLMLKVDIIPMGNV